MPAENQAEKNFEQEQTIQFLKPNFRDTFLQKHLDPLQKELAKEKPKSELEKKFLRLEKEKVK